MKLAVMTQSHGKSPFLIIVILLGKNSSSEFGKTPINYAWIDTYTTTFSYLDSPNAHFCCP